jgi:hypothetical protein
MLEIKFLDKVEKAIALYENLNEHAATRTRQMIAELGVIKALSRLMISPDLQQGFRVLRDSGQLDKSFESVVVKYQYLFDPEVVKAAQWRLEHPYELF